MANLVRIIAPNRDTAPARFGDFIRIAVDVSLDEPWFVLPSNLGSRMGALDGEPEPALAFQANGAVPVRALVSGKGAMRDSGIDDHGPSPLRAVKGGRGCELVVTSGALELTYSHLKRGSARGGPVRAGDTVGLTGNSGRCVNGARGHYVKIAARRRSSPVALEEFSEAYTLEAQLNGLPLVASEKLPPGETSFKRYELEKAPVLIERADQFRTGENELLVVLKRGSRTLARDAGAVVVEG